MSIVTIGDFKNYLQTVANAVSSGKMNVNDAEVKSVLQTIAAAVGEVSATPTANTLADRLKAIADRLGEVSANPTANTALARLKALEGYLDGVEAALGAQADAEATGNGSLIAIVKRLRTILTDVWDDAANALNVQLTGSNVNFMRLANNISVAPGARWDYGSLIDIREYQNWVLYVACTQQFSLGGYLSPDGVTRTTSQHWFSNIAATPIAGRPSYVFDLATLTGTIVNQVNKLAVGVQPFIDISSSAGNSAIIDVWLVRRPLR